MSSTAIVLRALQDRGEIDALHGQLASGTLLFQDLCIVPMMLIVPYLARSTQVSSIDVVWAIANDRRFGAHRLYRAQGLPRVLRQVALVRNCEIFVLVVVLVCVGTAWFSAKLGLSLALGALIAGLVISESELSHQDCCRYSAAARLLQRYIFYFHRHVGRSAGPLATIG